MKIDRIDTVTNPEYPQLVWVQIGTDGGLIGLGETSFGVAAVEEFIHSELASYLLGQDPLKIEAHWEAVRARGRSQMARNAEIRALSAIDVALWDIFGQAARMPVHQAMGGTFQDRIRVYNTCANYHSAVRRPPRGSRRSQVFTGDPETGCAEGPYNDHDAFLTRADELAESLLSEGFTAMKIWPFDQFYSEADGNSISEASLTKACEPFRKIRRAVGNRMEVAAELICRWNLPTAVRIAQALEEFDVMWIEDPIPMNNIDALADFRRKVRQPVTASETVAMRESFRELFERRAIDICMLDITWCGGLTESKKIAAMANSYKLPIAPHDCTGPVALMAGVHLSLHAPNAKIQETVRSFNAGWYPRIVDELPRIEGGFAYAPTRPGLGMALRESFVRDRDTVVRTSRAMGAASRPRARTPTRKR
jgi:L-alanine-DL-glutamate epimerase-like enolase superfamily enzyme